MSDGDEAAAGDGGPDGALGRPGEPPEWFSPDEGEEVRWVGQPAAVSLVGAAIWGLVLLPVFGLGLLVFASAYLSVTNTDFVVTNTSLYHKRGVLSTNIESVGLDRIQNTEFSQSFFGKQFGYGSIDISTAGSSGADVTFQAIEDPREVRDLINRLANAAGGQSAGGADRAAGASGGPTGGVDEELLQELLGELRAVNESMANVERLLREERGAPGSGGSGDSAASERSATTSSGSDSSGSTGAPDSSGTSGSASEFVSESGDADEDTQRSPFGDDDG